MTTCHWETSVVSQQNISIFVSGDPLWPYAVMNYSRTGIHQTYDFSALMLLVGHHEEHLTCKKY